jgi:5-methylcytosine-specific restriction endonuclease McrA
MRESLRSLSDRQLLVDTDAIAVQDRKLTLKLLVHLQEIERRKLYLKLGYASMFVYCTTHLRMSESVAVRRVKTARCLARFPQLYELLECGDVSVCSVSLVAKFLKPDSAEALIERIRGRSRREVESIVAELEPRTLLPPDRVRTVMLPVATSLQTSATRFTATGGGKESSSVETEAQGTPALEPYAAINFTARAEFMTKVERARGLVWHQCPNATFEQLFELGLDALIAQRDPAEREKRREKRGALLKKTAAVPGKRYVAAAVRDQAFMRAEFRCSYVGPDGRRCTATVALQVDHIVPVARGGCSNPENLRVLCAEHNRLEAQRLMGCAMPA